MGARESVAKCPGDGAIVAWHEVPGTAPPRKSRPVGYGVIRLHLRTRRPFRREIPLGLAAPDHTVPYGTVPSRDAFPRHFVPQPANLQYSSTPLLQMGLVSYNGSDGASPYRDSDEASPYQASPTRPTRVARSPSSLRRRRKSRGKIFLRAPEEARVHRPPTFR
jgi:hypothetical protein